jgi:hypothetical protein
MPDSQPLINALLDDTPGPVTVAIREARRTRQSRRVAASITAIVLITGFLACLRLGGHRTTSSETRIVTEDPGFRTFSTAGTPFSLRRVSTVETARPIAFFSNRDVRPAFREIDDQSLFELLHPYAPVIVYLGHGEQPTLLFLNHRP